MAHSSPTRCCMSKRSRRANSRDSRFHGDGPVARSCRYPGQSHGGVAYVQDLRLDGMLHGRVVRPPSYTAHWSMRRHAPSKDARRREGHPQRQLSRGGRGGGIRQSKRCARWRGRLSGTSGKACPIRHISRCCSSPWHAGWHCRRQQDDADRRREDDRGWYTRPYQMHGSIGPSCAVASSTATG